MGITYFRLGVPRVAKNGLRLHTEQMVVGQTQEGTERRGYFRPAQTSN